MKSLEILCICVYITTIMMTSKAGIPIVVNTWQWPQATVAAWNALQESSSPLDAVEQGCTECERFQCGGSVGYGGSPDESGETTLDAMIMDGSSMNVGSVGCLRSVKNAIGVARRVLENTEHTLLVGELATKFAKEMGFTEESLKTNASTKIWKDWQNATCQPNYWCNVTPNPKSFCGPYSPDNWVSSPKFSSRTDLGISESNHDTIGIVAINEKGHVASGTSTNGLTHKIPGRVGDSPIAGAGSYADNDVGGAVATGDGDVMMRFLPSYQIVESMRRGMTPMQAAEDAIQRILKRYPTFNGGVIGVSIDGSIGAACSGFTNFHYCVRNKDNRSTVVVPVKCIG